LKPQKEIAPGLPANINLIPGNSGADGDLPAYYNDGIYTTRWKLSLKERLLVFLSGNIWLNVMAVAHPPVRLDAEAPFEVVKIKKPWGTLWGTGELEPLEQKKQTEQTQPEPQKQPKPVFHPEDFTGAEDDTLEPEDEAEKEKRSGDDDRGFYS